MVHYDCEDLVRFPEAIESDCLSRGQSSAHSVVLVVAIFSICIKIRHRLSSTIMITFLCCPLTTSTGRDYKSRPHLNSARRRCGGWGSSAELAHEAACHVFAADMLTKLAALAPRVKPIVDWFTLR